MTRWYLFIIILAFYNCFSIPFQTAFEPPIMDESSFLIFNSFIDICFCLDILFSFRTSFFDSITGDEIFDKWLIAKNYGKGRFIIDFLSTVPLDNIAKVKQASLKRYRYSQTSKQLLFRFSVCSNWQE